MEVWIINACHSNNMEVYEDLMWGQDFISDTNDGKWWGYDDKVFCSKYLDFIRNVVNHFSLFQFEVHVFPVVSPKETSHDFSSLSRHHHCKVPLEAPRQGKGFKLMVSRHSCSGPDWITILSFICWYCDHQTHLFTTK